MKYVVNPLGKGLLLMLHCWKSGSRIFTPGQFTQEVLMSQAKAAVHLRVFSSVNPILLLRPWITTVVSLKIQIASSVMWLKEIPAA